MAEGDFGSISGNLSADFLLAACNLAVFHV